MLCGCGPWPDCWLCQRLEAPTRPDAAPLKGTRFFTKLQGLLQKQSSSTAPAGCWLFRVLSATEFVTFSDAHNRRNGSTYQSPFPPLSEREAKAVLDLLHQLIGLTEAHIATFTTR